MEIFDCDGTDDCNGTDSPAERVGLVLHTIPQNMNVGIESEPVTYRHRQHPDRSSIVLSFRVVCSSGFTGERCEMNIDDCQGMENPCNGRGQCVDGVNDFVCECDSGFTGRECQENIDDCAGVNCSGHGQCVDGVNSYSCVCDSGFTGMSCNESELCCICAS